MDRRIIALAWMPLLASLSFAEEPVSKPETAPSKKGQWVITLYGGKSATQDSELKIKIPSQNTSLTYENVEWDDDSLSGPIYYGYRVSFWPTPTATIGYAFDFIHYKAFAETGKSTNVTGTLNGQPYSQNEPISNTLERYSISHGINLLTLCVMGRKPMLISESFPDGRFQPYAGIGAGIVINHPESKINGDFFEQYQYGGPSWQVLAGGEYRLNKNLGLFMEFKYTDYTAEVDTSQGGTGRSRFQTSHFVLGTTYRF